MNLSSPSQLVVAVAYDRLCVFEFGIATEVFGLPRPEMGSNWYQFAVAAGEPGPLRATGGLGIHGDGGLELFEDAGTIVVPGWRNAREEPPRELVTALNAAHHRGVRLVSLCSGVFVLACAGILTGRRATTHWHYADLLAERYPDIKVEADVLYVDEGDVLTSAGSAAGIDLCLHIVRSDHGPDAANMVARRLVVPPHREGGQAQVVERAVAPEREGARLGPLFDLMRQRLSERQPLSRLARDAGMSERTLLRRFKASTGRTPGEWLLEERLQEAKTLLVMTSRSIDDVAVSCGIGTADNLRHHFRKRFGLSPGAYRAQFNELMTAS